MEELCEGSILKIDQDRWSELCSPAYIRAIILPFKKHKTEDNQ